MVNLFSWWNLWKYCRFLQKVKKKVLKRRLWLIVAHFSSERYFCIFFIEFLMSEAKKSSSKSFWGEVCLQPAYSQNSLQFLPLKFLDFKYDWPQCASAQCGVNGKKRLLSIFWLFLKDQTSPPKDLDDDFLACDVKNSIKIMQKYHLRKKNVWQLITLVFSALQKSTIVQRFIKVVL